MSRPHPAQLGFEALLQSADDDNRARVLARQTSHLPGTMAEALPFFDGLLAAHHAAMLAADIEETMRLREEAVLLATRLNGGRAGILADEDAPGCALARASAAAPGAVPLWGQEGTFAITAHGVPVRIELDGVFGTGSRHLYWPGFAAHAVDWRRPFISETGYRSFIGISAEAAPGLLPDAFAAKIIEAHIARELKGRLRPIEASYRERHEGAD